MTAGSAPDTSRRCRAGAATTARRARHRGPAHAGSSGSGVLEHRTSSRCAEHGVDHRSGSRRRCGEQVTYADHAARPGRGDRGLEQVLLQEPGSITSSGVRRQRASGRRRSAPRPLHGTSARTRSNDPPGQVGLVPSPIRTLWSPGIARRLARTRSARCLSGSTAVSRPSRCWTRAARSADFPPGPAQRSSHLVSSPSSGAIASAVASAASPRPEHRPGRWPLPGAGRGHHRLAGQPRTATTSQESPRPRPTRPHPPTPDAQQASPEAARYPRRASARAPRRRLARSAALTLSPQRSRRLLSPSGGVPWRSRDSPTRSSWGGGATAPIHWSRERWLILRRTALTEPLSIKPFSERVNVTISLTAAYESTRIRSN